MCKSIQRSLVLSVTVLFILFSQLAFAWERYYGTWYDDFGYSVKETWDGYVFGGATRQSEEHWDAYLVNVAQNGNIIWSNNYGITDSLEILHAAEQTYDGGILAIGESWDMDASIQEWGRGFMVKTNYYGTEEWRYHRFEGYKAFNSMVIIEAEDSVVVTGWVKVGAPGATCTALLWGKYGPIHSRKGPGSGNEKSYLCNVHSEGNCIKKTNNGFIIAGVTYSENTGYPDGDIFLLKLNDEGNFQGQAEIGGSDDDCGYGVAVTNDGGFIVVGSTRSYGAGEQDVYLVKTTSALNVVWAKTYGSAKDDIGYSVVQLNDGCYLVCGATKNTPNQCDDIYLIKTDANGNKIWERTFGRADYFDVGYSIQKTYDGGYVIGGTCRYGDCIALNGDEVYGLYKPVINAPTALCFDPVVYEGATLHWTDNSSNEDGFEIDRKIGASGTYITIGYTGANQTSYYDNDIETYYGQQLIYRVRAIMEGATSDPSNECSVTPPGIFVDNNAAICGPKNIARDGVQDYHLVFKHRGDLWYTKSTDNGASWSNAVSLNTTNPSCPSLVIANGDPRTFCNTIENEKGIDIGNRTGKLECIAGNNQNLGEMIVCNKEEKKKNRSGNKALENRDTNVPCFAWEEEQSGIHYGMYAYLDNGGQLHKTTIVSAPHTVQPVISIDNSDWIACSYISDPSNDYGKIAYFDFYYNLPNVVIGEFDYCDLPGGLRITTDTQNNPHLVWHENLVQNFLVINEIVHGTFDGYKEQVAKGWITGGYARRVSNPEIAAISPTNIEYAYSVYNVQSQVNDILYKKKGWPNHINISLDDDIGQAYDPRIMRNQNVVLCRGYSNGNYKVFACYPNNPLNANEIINSIHNHYDAILIPSGSALVHAAIAYTKSIGLGLYQLHFDIKVVGDPSQNPQDGLQGSEEAYNGPFTLLDIFPNPTGSILQIRFMSPDDRIATIKLYDVTGRMVTTIDKVSAKNGLNQMTFNTDNIASGIYFVRCETENEEFTDKIIIQR